ncbi:Fc.00g050670.m01.CDS01 [Cosmosporella sp. VM-42]
MSLTESLDMSLFFGTPEQKKQFCDSLLNILKKRGVAKIKNHGIPEEMIHELFSQTRKFFNLTYDEKMTAKHPLAANPNRGYSYVGQENVANISGYEKGKPEGLKTKDIKETLDMGAPSDHLVGNIWVAEEILPGFRTFMESFYEQAFNTTLHILAALAKALGVQEEDLRTLHTKAENEFRLLHYPAIPASRLKDGTSTRIAEHTDFGTITMLFQDSTGGLQVEDQTNLGTFHDVISKSKTDIILNIGDSLQRLTNDTFKAACHRVTYPPTVKLDDEEVVIPERFSVAYFAKPNRDASLLPLKHFITDATPCTYKDITAWEWNNLRIGKLYG